MNITPTIRVNLDNPFTKDDAAIITKATLQDMPRENWQCAWVRLFENTNEQYGEGLVKMEYQGSVMGLMKFAFYPDPPDRIEVLEILNLEALPRGQRIVNPVGRWLIWYAANLALNYCPPEPTAQILFLNSVQAAFSYYRDKIGMEYIQPVTLAPGEDGYALRFNRENAQKFCEQQEQSYGRPIILSSRS